jgi:hypothetical protein
VIVGITGHQHLDDSSAWDWVEVQLERVLREVTPPLTGVTSLAIGADQLFADVVLRLGGTLRAVVPFEGYQQKFEAGKDRRNYKRLLRKASEVEVLEKCDSDELAYLEAGKRMVDRSDLLIAVWDGKPAEGVGGTADAVEYAKRHGIPVFHLNPVERTVRAYQATQI